MLRTMLKSKIHRAKVTDANLEYEGSVSIDPKLCDAAQICEFEQVEIYNCNAGTRLSTYVIYGSEGEICLNGAAARLVQKGDLVIICSYVQMQEDEIKTHKPSLVFVNADNKIVSQS